MLPIRLHTGHSITARRLPRRRQQRRPPTSALSHDRHPRCAAVSLEPFRDGAPDETGRAKRRGWLRAAFAQLMVRATFARLQAAGGSTQRCALEACR